MISLLDPVALLTIALASFLQFLLPGGAVSLSIAARRRLEPPHGLILTIASAATFGYAAFWVYFANKIAGEIFSYSVTAGSIAIIGFHLAHSRESRLLLRRLATPLLYSFAVSICYLSLFYLFSNPFRSGVDLANRRFFVAERPGDNLIPLFFAEKIYDRQPVSPICCGNWLSSDRPPLQAGIFLLQRPVRLFGGSGLQYQCLATVLQCLWICGVWVLLSVLRAPPRRVEQALGFLIFTGFFFYNSVYAWPKMLAATFMLFGVALVLDSYITRRPLTRFEILLGAASFSLAILAHPGGVFTVPALAVLIFKRTARSQIVSWVFAALIVLGFVAPWTAYQRFYDPPGNRLLKMHLAGVAEIDSRSTWQALRDRYGNQSGRSLIRNKWSNLTTLIGPSVLPGFGWNSTARLAQRDYIVSALVFLNAGWLPMAFMLSRRRPESALPQAGLLVIIALGNIVSWSLLLFGPAQTGTAHASYADILLLSIGLLGFLLALPRLILCVLYVLQILNCFVAWVFFKPLSVPLKTNVQVPPNINWPLLVTGLLCALALICYFGSALMARSDA